MDTEATEITVPTPLYDTSDRAPAANAPERDLPPAMRAVFEALRKSCLTIPGVEENIRHEGPVWKWIWAYEVDGFTICVIHPMNDSVDLSFPLPTRFEPLYKESGLDELVVKGISKGGIAARVRYVRFNVPDMESGSKIFAAVEYKLKLLSKS